MCYFSKKFERRQYSCCGPCGHVGSVYEAAEWRRPEDLFRIQRHNTQGALSGTMHAQEGSRESTVRNSKQRYTAHRSHGQFQL